MIEQEIKVKYTTDSVDMHGRVWGQSEWVEGIFINFADDYKLVVIKTSDGEIIRRPIAFVRFLGG